MTRKLFLIGLLATVYPIVASAQTVLEEIERITLGENMAAGTELDVQRYLPLILNGRLYHPVTEDDVDIAVKKSSELLCVSWDESQGNCLSTKEIDRQARRAAWHRTLARDLQLIVTGHEKGLVGYSGQSSPLDTGLPGLLNIWQSGVDEMTNPVVSKTPGGAPVDLEDTEDTISAIKGELQQLIERKNGKESRRLLTAAVFRYRHGINQVTRLEGTCPGATAQNDMEILTTRFCPLESHLRELASSLPESTEQIVYQPIVLDDLQIIIWIRQDDVGLQWQLALEPVLPTLSSRLAPDTARLGGTYPDDIKEPTPAEGICSHPIGARGYLCRPVQTGECPAVSGTPQSLDSTAETLPEGLTITLTECLPTNYKAELPIHVTEAGPDICTTGGWRLPLDQPSSNFSDGPYVDAQCNSCIPQVECGSGSSSEPCNTGEYDEATGFIKVCVNNELKIPAKYKVMKELVVAQQLCNRSDPTKALMEHVTKPEVCCAVQWYPSLIACKAMAADGNFTATDIGVLECAGAVANHSCGGACSASPPKEAGETAAETKRKEEEQQQREAAVIQRIETVVEAHSGDGEACSTFTEPDVPDDRVKSIRASFPVSCSPNCKVQYENTIGNNLCYIGQCVEQAMEGARLIPGRLTLTSGDEAYPWDACAAPDPQNGAYIELPPAHIPFVPPYEGLELVRAADIAVCQVNGYPPLTPPVLCLFSPARQLALPQDEGSRQATGFQSQAEAQAVRSFLAQAESASIGVRAATTLYEEFIERSLGEFGSLIKVATELIRQIGETPWPSTMCPRYNENGCSVFRSQ